MLLTLIIILVGWLLAMTILITPTATYSSFFDRITKAKFRNDRVNLQIMLDHLRSFPEEWSISRDAVSFPLKGSKVIYLNYDKKENEWNYSLSSFDGSPRPLDGHFGKQFQEEIVLINNRREAQSLLRNFYPDLDNSQLLLK